jgi:hypothetical protein
MDRSPEAIDVGWLVELLWDGLRNLPYSDMDIAEAIGLLAALTISVAEGETSIEAICSSCLGDVIEVDFGSKDGSGGRSFVSERSLLSAVRKDVGHYLADPDYQNDISLLLQAIWDPSRLFEFGILACVWAREIAPIQVLKYKDESVVFYSPASVDSFGLP